MAGGRAAKVLSMRVALLALHLGCCACLRLHPTGSQRAGPARSRLQRSGRAMMADELDLDEVWWEDSLTCVEFLGTDGVLRLGVYVPYSVVEDAPHIRPLCASSDDEGIAALLCDEEAPAAPLSAVRRVLDPDYVFVSERQAGGGQGLGNPHGEHGEECYDLTEVPGGLSEGVHVVVREGRDTERVL